MTEEDETEQPQVITVQLTGPSAASSYQKLFPNVDVPSGDPPPFGNSTSGKRSKSSERADYRRSRRDDCSDRSSDQLGNPQDLGKRTNLL